MLDSTIDCSVAIAVIIRGDGTTAIVEDLLADDCDLSFTLLVFNQSLCIATRIFKYAITEAIQIPD